MGIIRFPEWYIRFSNSAHDTNKRTVENPSLAAMLYTGKGDTGTTKLFGCDQRFSKSSIVADALGTVDELNSFLGLCKAKARERSFVLNKEAVTDILEDVQQKLFIVQAELAGADKRLGISAVGALEKNISEIEKQLPPIKSFFISGGTELAAMFDVARTIARRAERTVVAFYMERDTNAMPYGQDTVRAGVPIQEPVLAYANRLSSLLYALARLANQQAGVAENAPRYT